MARSDGKNGFEGSRSCPQGCGSIYAKLPVFTADFTVKRHPALRSRPQSPCRTVRPTRVRTPPSMLQRARALVDQDLVGGRCRSAQPLALRLAHAAPALAEKPGFAPENLRFRRRLVAEIARPCRRGRRRRAGRHGTFRTSRSRRSETSLRWHGKSRPPVRRSFSRNVRLSGAASATATSVGPHLADMSDLRVAPSPCRLPAQN